MAPLRTSAPTATFAPPQRHRIALAAPLASRRTRRRTAEARGRATASASASAPAIALSSTVPPPSASEPGERSRARSSIAPPTVSSRAVPPAVQYRLTRAEASARTAAAHAGHRRLRRFRMTPTVEAARQNQEGADRQPAARLAYSGGGTPRAPRALPRPPPRGPARP